MMNRSCLREEELRVREEIFRASSQCRRGVSAPQRGDWLSNGEVLEEFEIVHRPEGFGEFFSRIEKHQRERGCAVAVAMEGYNGYVRPLDSLVRQRGYRL